jgi:hypothetical protein
MLHDWSVVVADCFIETRILIPYFHEICLGHWSAHPKELGWWSGGYAWTRKLVSV